MISCDIDGTLIYSELIDGTYHVTGYNTALIHKINALYNSGEIIILHTGRHWNHFKLTIEQLKNAGVKYHSIVHGKPPADIYIDDKAVRPDEFLDR